METSDRTSSSANLILPAKDFKPKLNKGIAWCPYCGQAQQFSWDAETWYARCPGCGISAEDFHTKSCNGLWDRSAATRFEAAVKASGRRFSWKSSRG